MQAGNVGGRVSYTIGRIKLFKAPSPTTGCSIPQRLGSHPMLDRDTCSAGANPSRARKAAERRMHSSLACRSVDVRRGAVIRLP